MIRLIQRRLIIPRGDTGTFTVPVLATTQTGAAAVFTILDPKTNKKIWEKLITDITTEEIQIEFSHADTVNLPVGNYLWDIKFYSQPTIVDNVLVDGIEVDSYYAAFKMPVCEIRQTGDHLLTAEDSPSATIAPEFLNILTSALSEIQHLTVEVVKLSPDEEPTATYDNKNWQLRLGIPQGETGNGIDSINLNADYTLTINYTDGSQITTTSVRGEKGETGKPFGIAHVYSSIAEMNADYSNSNIEIGDFVIIASNVEDPDNARLYVKGASQYDFIVDMSGIQGQTGYTPQRGVDYWTAADQLIFQNNTMTSIQNSAVRYDQQQMLTEAQKGRARTNIGAAPESILNAFYSQNSLLNNIGMNESAELSNFTCTRINNEIMLQGSLSQSALPLKIKLSGALDLGATSSLVTKFKNPIVLKENHNYRWKQIYLDGSSTSSITPRVIAHGRSENYGTVALTSATESHTDFTYNSLNFPEGLHLVVQVLRSAGDNNFEDWSAKYVLEDLTEQQQFTDMLNNIAPIEYNPAQGEHEVDDLFIVDGQLLIAIDTITPGETLRIGQNVEEMTVSGALFNKADKANTVLDTTLSRGRLEDSLIGNASLAFGYDVIASGNYSTATGLDTSATGQASHAEGDGTSSLGRSSHAEGTGSQANGEASHAEGILTQAGGISSHAEGAYNYALARNVHAEGVNNISRADHSHIEGVDNELTANQIATHVSGVYSLAPNTAGKTIGISGKKTPNGQYLDITYSVTLGKFAEIVGNGDGKNARSNARALDWNGNGYYAGNVYVNCNADSTGGTRLATINDIPEDNRFIVYFTLTRQNPSADVEVSCDKTVAEITAAFQNQKTVIGQVSEGNILLFGSEIMSGLVLFQGLAVGQYVMITGMAQNNNDIWQMSSSVLLLAEQNGDYNAVNKKITNLNAPTENKDAANKQYVDNAIANVNTMKIHICTAAEYNAQTGVPTIANPDTQTFYLVPGGEGNNLFIEWAYVNSAWERFGSADVDLSNYVQKTDYATSSVGGVVKIAGNSGISLVNNALYLQGATSNDIKSASISYKPIMPLREHEAIFYGLAKAAGDSTQSASSNAVGTYTNEAKAAIQQMLDVPSTSDIPDVPVKEVQVNSVSVLDAQGTANIPIASANVFGVVKKGPGVNVSSAGILTTQPATDAQIKNTSNSYNVIAPDKEHMATFYGLAKAAGDTTQSQSANAVGTYTAEAKAAIQTMLDVPSKQDIADIIAIQPTQPTDPDTKIWIDDDASGSVQVPTVSEMESALATKVDDVQVNGVSVVSNGVANVPVATNNTGIAGVVKIDTAYGLEANNGYARIYRARTDDIKASSGTYQPIVPAAQHYSVFYGLAKAAGDTTQSASDNAVGTYTPEAKGAIQHMLGVSDLIAPAENALIASQAYNVGDMFTANGKLYKVTVAIAANESIITQDEGETVTGANAVETKVGEGFVKFTDYASLTDAGVVKISNNGIGINVNKAIQTIPAGSSSIKSGTINYNPIVPLHQHESVFYGLAKAAGADEKDSTLPIGEYTDTAKSAIRTMLGAVGTEDYATTNSYGLVKVSSNYGITQNGGTGALQIVGATAAQCKSRTGSTGYQPLTVYTEDASAFYGLAYAAGDTTMASSSNAVGTYTDSAKASIKSMLGIVDGSTGTVDVTGTTPTITAVENTRYVCGEVATLTITPPASGICIIRFTSGTTATVLTATGVVWPEWFDATALEASRVYEICITDGYGMVMSWAQ